MVVVAVEVTVACPGCATVVPVNGALGSVPCSGCSRAIAIAPATWPEVLREPVEKGARDALHDERTSSLRTEAGTVRVVSRRAHAATCACGAAAPIDDAAAIARGHVFCGHCGQRLSMRAAPTELAGARLLVGERAPNEAQASAESQAILCATCGAPLTLAFGDRSGACSHCGVTSHVADEVWDRLRRGVRRWFVVCDAVASVAPALATWTTLGDAVVDGDGNVYCLGALDASATSAAVFSFDREMRMRWAKRDLPNRAPDGARVFISRTGHLGVWQPGKRQAHFLRPDTGETDVVYPTGEGKGPVALDACVALAGDADGSLLALVRGKAWGGMPEHVIFTRFSIAGELVPLWPEVPRARQAEIGETIPRLRELGSSPAWVQGSPSLSLGWNDQMHVTALEMIGGGIDLGGRIKRTDRSFCARVRRDGQADVMAPMPSREGSKLGADQSGALWLLSGGRLERLDRYGKLLLALEPVASGGVIGDEHVLTVQPDGTAVLLGHGGQLRRIRPDGQIDRVSAASRALDDTRRND